MPMLRTKPRPSESESLGMVPREYFLKILQVILMLSEVETTNLES